MMRLLLLCVSWLCLCSTAATAFVAQQGSLTHNGLERAHYLHVPQNADATTPLVIALHGMGGNARNMRFGLGLTEILDAAGFAVVYPQGVRLPQGSRHWNAGFDFMAVDDIGYLTALAEQIIADHGLSEQRVMIFGISMGGYMAYHMACHSDLPIGAIVVVAGSMHPTNWQNCSAPSQPSLLHIHGEKDPLIPFGGGGHWSARDQKPLSINDIVYAWRDLLHATSAETVKSTPIIREKRFTNVLTGKEVQLIALPEFGHDWPSQQKSGYDVLTGVAQFLSRHRVDETE